MSVERPETRLQSLWGLIDRQHNREIERRLRGRRVLDVGCGYGALVAYLQGRGFEATGVDLDRASIEAGKRLFPKADIRLAKADELGPEAHGTFDSITLKDCLHHLVGEHVEEQSFAAFGQLLRPGGRLVVLDPNPNWILRAARVLASHRDFQTPLDEARRVLERYGFRVRSVDFYEVMGLPLSGGYVFKELVPRIRPLHELVAGLNLLLSRLVARAGLGPAICWRYVIAADFDPARSSGAVPSSTAPEAR